MANAAMQTRTGNYDSVAVQMKAAVQETTAYDTLGRSLARIELIVEGLYDDDKSDPEQALSDLFTDILHAAKARAVDAHHLIHRARAMFMMEDQMWSNHTSS